MADKLEVFIFFSPHCPRCKSMRGVVAEAKRVFGRTIKFHWMDTSKPTVQMIMRRKYPCIGRIPSTVALGDIYWVGTPDKKDFIGVLGYLATHPEGGQGAFHGKG